jgi:hypothetical protein
MLQDSDRSRVIVCHSQEIGNILLYYIILLSHGIHMNNDRRPSRIVLGIGYGLSWAIRARLWLHLSRLCRLRTVRCMDLGQVTDLLSRAHTCLGEREDLLLSCHGLRLFPD